MLTNIDTAAIILYAILVIGIGFFFYSKVSSMEDFYLAGRRLPLSLTVGTLMATWYGASGTIATAEYAFAFGLSCWVVWCIPAHLSRIPLALWIAPKVRMADSITMPDLLEKLYDKRTAIVCSIMLLFYCTVVYEVTALQVLGSSVWQINGFWFAAACVGVVVIYTILGGLLSVAVTDMMQMVFMVVGLCIALPFAWADTGGWANIMSGLSGQGALDIMSPLGGMSPFKMITLVILGLCAYSDPTFYQRFSAAESQSTARRGFLICLCIWIAFDFCITMMGIIARVQYPEMVAGTAYLTLSLSYLPPILKGLFIAGILGAIMSTLDSYYLIGGTTMARDLYMKLFNPRATDRQIVNWTRIGVVLMGLIGILLAGQFTMVADAWVFVGGLYIAASVVPVVGGLFWPYKRTAMGGLLSMIVGGGTVAVWQILGSPLGVDGLLVAFPLSFIFFLIGNQFGPSLTITKKGGVTHV
jgi:SSS family solute:Na+ symporter